MNLHELFTSINESSLSKGQLEAYEQELANLYSTYMLEIGSLKKSRALYFLERQKPDVSDVSIRRIWDSTGEGQSLIEYEANVKAVGTMMRSVRSRIYQSPY